MDDIFPDLDIDNLDEEDKDDVLSLSEIEGFIATAKKLVQHMDFFESAKCRKLRKALHPLVDNLRKKSFGGTTRSDYEEKKMIYKDRLGRLARQKALDAKYLNSVKLREERLKKMKLLREENSGHDVPFVPDGTAEDLPTLKNVEAIEQDNGVMEHEEGKKISQDMPKQLFKPRSCYVCKRRYTSLHTFYDMLCPDCAKLNFEKRKQSSDMKGFVCLITGGRVKIGYQVVLKLLRAGAHCIVTTRFPKDCSLRYASVEDASDWLDRLDIFGLDFRDINRLENFCTYLISTYGKLDVIINNACQTIRRPVKYYTPLLKTEMGDVTELSKKYGNSVTHLSKVLLKQQQFERECALRIADEHDNKQDRLKGKDGRLGRIETANTGKTSLNISKSLDMSLSLHLRQMVNSAEQSQIAVIKEDLLSTEKKFPKDILDVNGQQIDLRKTNTWVTPMEDVEVGEITEVFAINALAPFIINSKLVPLLEHGDHKYKFIVNVSAMEGKFNRVKSGYHPHTNMAKAALNMMTATSSKRLSQKNIFMTSVDTGWINEENPLEKASKYAAKHNFQTPLDEIDAASRILDPIFTALNTNDPKYGVFFKDYHETEW